jgi:hypothetical protein
MRRIRPGLPPLPPYASEDWEAMREDLFEDHDFLALSYEPAGGAPEVARGEHLLTEQERA